MRLVIPNLMPGKNYAVQVRANYGDSQSNWSARHTVVVASDLTRPEIPQNVTWEVSGDSFYGEWDAVTQNTNSEDIVVSRYEVQLSGNSKVVTVSVPAQTGARVNFTLNFEQNRAVFGSPAATVSMQVRAVDAKGAKSDLSSSISKTNPAPAEPDNVSADEMYDAVSLTWDASEEPDLQHYLVQVSYTGTGGPYLPVHTGASTSFIHHTTQFNTDHYYRVFVVDKFNTASSSVTVGPVRPKSTFAVDDEPPENATNFSVTPNFDVNTQTAYADVSWDSSTSTDVGRYIIRYSTDGINWQYEEAPHDENGLRIENLIPNASYYFSIRTSDFTGNMSAWQNHSPYPITSAKDNTAPSQPAAPSATAGTQRMQVSVTGNKSGGGAMEPDVDYYEVFASTTNNFSTYNSTTMLGTIQAGPAMVETFQIPATASSGTSQTWYVKVRAVDRSGNVSPASAQATAAVGLIETANIGDAQITNAKISNLSADKLEAGTINTGDINVASNIIVGTASSPGAIKSYNYNGTDGFLIDKSGITIKTGTIEAAALNIQQGGNLMPPQYADFEYSADAYEEDRLENVNATIDTTSARAHGQSRKVWWASTPGGTRIMWMAPTGEVYKTNLINDASMENGGTGWHGSFAWTGVVPTNNASVSWHGERSLEFKSPTAGDGFAVYPFETTDMEVEPNKGYTFSVYVYSPSVSRNAAAAITYFDSDGVIIGSVNWGSTSATTVGQWQRFGVTTTSPTNAAYAQVGLYMAGTAQNEVHLIDAALFQKANVLHNFFEGTVIDATTGEPQENIVVEPGQSYVVSAYFNAGMTSTPVEFVAWDNLGNTTTMTNYRYNDVATSAPITLTPVGTWKRVSAVWTAPAGVTHVALGVRSNSTNPGEYLVDAVQFEPKTSLSTRPSTWMPGGMGTTIDGGLIKTGAIQSNQPAFDVNGDEIPGVKAWSINTDGSAVLGNALIRGTLVMGAQGTEEPIGPDGAGTSQGVSEMRSYNYVPGAQGWSIRSNGEAEFLQLRSGSIQGSAIAAGSFRPDQLGEGTIAAEILIGNRMISEERIDLTDTLYSMSRTANQLTLNSGTFNYFPPVPVGGRLKMKITSEVSSVIGAEISDGVATLTFADERSVDFEIGDELQVDGVGILYDTRGTTAVTAATATTVSYAVDSADEVFHTAGGTVTSVYTDLTNEDEGFLVLEYSEGLYGSNSTVTVQAPGGDFESAIVGIASNRYVDHAVATGRQVSISPSGLQLIEASGMASVELPTDSSRPSRFSGAINTSELLVDDGLSLSGETNKMTSGAVLTLASLANNPTRAPSIVSGGPAETIDSWVNGDDEYSSRRQGFGIYGDKFYFANMFWGGQQMVMNADGTYSGNITMPTTTYKFNPYGGMVKLGTKWYVLGWSVDLSRWQVWRFYSRADGLIGDFEVALFNYDERASFGATAKQWNEGVYQKSPLGRPAIGTDGTDLYIARAGVSGEIRWTTYTAGGSKINNYRTNTTVRRGTDIASILIGNFDYGSKRYIVTTRNQNLDKMFGSGVGRNYVFSTTFGSNGYVQNTNESWNVYDDTWIGESDCLGLAWDGASFWSMQDSGNIFKYTDISKSGTTTIYAKYTWYDPQHFTVGVNKKRIANGVATLWLDSTSNYFAEGDEIYVQGVGSGLDGYWISLDTSWSGQVTFATPLLGDVAETSVSGTVSNVEHETELSPVGKGPAPRRMSIRVTSPTEPPGSLFGTGNTGGSARDPLSSARFYLSTDGTTFYLNDGIDGPTVDWSAGYGITLNAMPETSGPTTPTARPFPRAIPAKIISEDGELEISADGFIRTDRAIIRSNKDANTDIGNEPALMVGNDAGTHLRIDNNEIIAMASPSEQGTLILNAGGQVNVTTLRTPTLVGPATVDGSLFVNNNMTVSNNTTLSGNLTVNGTATIGGKNISKMNFAQFSGTTNASGTVTIAHGMGTTPTFVGAFVNGTSTYACTVNGKNATNITLGVRNYATGALVTGANLTFQYFAID